MAGKVNHQSNIDNQDLSSISLLLPTHMVQEQVLNHAVEQTILINSINIHRASKLKFNLNAFISFSLFAESALVYG